MMVTHGISWPFITASRIKVSGDSWPPEQSYFHWGAPWPAAGEALVPSNDCPHVWRGHVGSTCTS